MKKIVRLTESDLQRIVKRVIKENELMGNYDDFNYDINSFDCGDKVMSGTVDIDGDGTIMINYCSGNEGDLEYLKEKGRELVKKMMSDFNKIGGTLFEDESMGDMDPISQFTPSELMDIKNNVIRYSQPGFFEDNEAGIYLFYTVANGDQSLYDSLVDWLSRNGVDTYLL